MANCQNISLLYISNIRLPTSCFIESNKIWDHFLKTKVDVSKFFGNDDLKLRVNLYHFNQNGMENT